jgi:hypothetical protein
MVLLRTLLCFVIVAGVSAPALALDTMGRVDQGWTLGIGFGMGRAHVDYFGGEVAEDLREGVNTEWRIGKLLTPNLALTFDYQGWMLEEGDLTRFPARFRQSLQIWGLALTWYPGNPETAWGGMYFRLSGGPALANFAITTVPGEDPSEIHGDQERLDEWGWGVGSSVGYEFFVTDTVGIGPSLNFAYQSIQTDDLDSTLGGAIGEQLIDQGRWLTLTILGTWYF